MAKTVKKSNQRSAETHTVAIWPYWPHIIFGVFGLIIAAYGASMVSYDIEQYATQVAYDSSSWKQGIGVVIFGSLIIGGAIANASHYQKAKAKH